MQLVNFFLILLPLIAGFAYCERFKKPRRTYTRDKKGRFIQKPVTFINDSWKASL